MLQINSFERSYPFWAKTNVFFLDLLDENTININEADNNTFSRVFKMLFNLLSRENPYGHVYKVVGGFTNKETELTNFFLQSRQ